MPVLKQLFGITREIKFELCITFDDQWEEDLTNSITEAMVKVAQEIVEQAKTEAHNYVNKVLLEQLESQSSENPDDFGETTETQYKESEKAYQEYLLQQNEELGNNIHKRN